MSFIWPWMLATLALVPLGIAAYVLIGRRRRARFAGAGNAVLAARTPSRGRRLLGALPGAMTVVALTIIVISLARPEAILSVPRPEGTVILTLDVSGSMAADDVQPSRLEVAKAMAREFVATRPEGVVIGVVAFGDAGLTVQLPTRDAATLERAIARLSPTFGTSLGEGIIAALDVIARQAEGTPPETYSSLPSPDPAPREGSAVEPGSRAETAIVLFSDGENTAPPEPAEAAQAAAERGIRIHTVGLGTAEGTTLELEDFVVHTSLDEPLLQDLAARTAGTYMALDPDAADAAPDDLPTLDVASLYDGLGSAMVTRPEHLEVTSLVAGTGVVLLITAVVLSLLLAGRLP
jgi:Ca-activated chloride channel family protein